MVKCKTKVRPHPTKGVEIEFIGDCGELVEDIMKNLGPYGQQYWKRKMAFVEKERETTTSTRAK
jgi:hypothetical protein